MKIYEVYQRTEMPDVGPDHFEVKRQFEPRKGAAKKVGREWNGGKRLTEKCGIVITEHVITGGRGGMCQWLNELLNPSKKKAAPKVSAKKAKAKSKKRRGK